MAVARICLCLSAALLIGCGDSDPCSNVAGTCIGVQLGGSVVALDQVAVSLDRPTPRTMLDPSAPGHVSLPVQFALRPPAGVGGRFHVGIDGLAHGAVVAHADADLDVPAGAHVTHSFTLQATSVVPIGNGGSGGSGGSGDSGGNGGVGGYGGDGGPSCGTQCVNGDGCCPSGCDANHDSDCQPSCGNGVVESGEQCDDHNSDNGDGCDPTCRFTNTTDTLAGKPGGPGYADGVGANARFVGDGVITGDPAGTLIYIGDRDTIRKFDPATKTVTTLSGVFGDDRVVQGGVMDARYQSITDIQIVQKVVYVLDDGKIRAFDTTTSTVAAVDGPTGVTALGTGSSFDQLAYLDGTGAWIYDGKSAPVRLAAAADFTTIGVDFTQCSDVAGWSNNDYLFLCGSRLVEDKAGVFSIPAGNATTGCAPSSASSTGTFSAPQSLLYVNTAYVADTGCYDVRSYFPGQHGGLFNWAGSGFTGIDDNTDSTKATFWLPWSLAAAASGPIYVMDFVALRQVPFQSFSRGGAVATVAGSMNFAANYDVTGAATRFGWHDAAVSVTSNGKLAFILQRNGSPFLLSVDLGSGATKNILPASATGFGPLGATAVGDTVYLVYDKGVKSLTGTTLADYLAPLATATFTGPVANDGSKLYAVTDGGKVVSLVTETGVHAIAGDSHATTVQDGIGINAQFGAIRALASDGTYLYASDSNTIRRIGIADGKVTTLAGMPGQAGLVDGVGSDARLGAVSALASDGKSVFLSGDASTPLLRQLVVESGRVSTMIGTPTRFGILNGVGKAASFSAPGAITFDATSKALLLFDNHDEALQRVR